MKNSEVVKKKAEKYMEKIKETNPEKLHLFTFQTPFVNNIKRN